MQRQLHFMEGSSSCYILMNITPQSNTQNFGEILWSCETRSIPHPHSFSMISLSLSDENIPSLAPHYLAASFKFTFPSNWECSAVLAEPRVDWQQQFCLRNARRRSTGSRMDSSQRPRWDVGWTSLFDRLLIQWFWTSIQFSRLSSFYLGGSPRMQWQRSWADGSLETPEQGFPSMVLLSFFTHEIRQCHYHASRFQPPKSKMLLCAWAYHMDWISPLSINDRCTNWRCVSDVFT